MRRIATSSREAGSLLPLLVSGLVVSVLVWGWSLREEYYLTPASGLGYGLGALGTVCMVLLLGYSLRKRLAGMQDWGPIRPWFRVHMALGLAAPIAILFHANFHLGSLNSSVALGCVLLVAGSGVVGRMIYPKIHDVFSGSRSTLRELGTELESSRNSLADAAPVLAGALKDLERFALSPQRGFARTTWRFLRLPVVARSTQRRCLRALGARASAGEQPALRAALRAHVGSVRRVAQFGAYERLFSLWHALHLPLCFILFGAAVAHVIAVHMY